MNLKFLLLLSHAASFVVGYTNIRKRNWGHATSLAERYIGIIFRLELRLDIVNTIISRCIVYSYISIFYISSM